METRLFNYFADQGLLDKLNATQVAKFRAACKKVIAENEGLDFMDLCVASKIYLNFIRDFPDLTL